MQVEEIEKSFLRILIYDDAGGQLFNRGNINPNYFYLDVNKKIFQTICDLRSDGIEPESAIIFDRLKDDPDFKAANRNGLYLVSIQETIALPVNFDYYLNILKENFQKRVISTQCIKIEQGLRDESISLVDAKKQLQATAESVKSDNQRIELVKLAQCKEPDKREWLLDGLIPLGFPTTLYSSGGTGKSYLAIHWAIRACIGRQNFLDFEFCSKPLNTVFIDYELDESEIVKRSYEVARGMGFDSPPSNFHYYAPKDNIMALLNDLPDVIKDKAIDLVILDSMGAGGIDAFDPNLVSNTYNKLRDLGVTSIVIDHQAKAQASDNPEFTTTPYGSVYKFNMCRSVLRLKYEQKIDNGMTLKLIQTKNNFGQIQDACHIDIIFRDEKVYIGKSSSVTQEVEDMLMILDAIEQLQKEQDYINQKDLIGYFKNTIGKDRLIKLLKLGEGKYWTREKGLKGSSFVYIPLDNDDQNKDVLTAVS